MGPADTGTLASIITSLENSTNVSVAPNISTISENCTSFGTNNSSQDNCNGQAFTHVLSPTSVFMITYFVVRILWSVLALVGNTLTIVVVSKFEELHTNNNFLICSLAAADILGGLLTPLDMAYHILYKDPSYVPICLVEKMLALASTTGNLISIFYISVDRYIFIRYPLRYHTIVTHTKIFVILAITWVYFAFGVPFTMYLSNHLTVGMPCKYVLFLHPVVYYFFLMPQFLILLTLTIAFFIAIARIAHKQKIAVAVELQSTDSAQAAASLKSNKIAKMMGAILGVYLISIMPAYTMTLVIKNMTTESSLMVEKLTTLMYWAGTWVNPIIYVFKVKEFRSPLKRLLRIE